MTDTRKPYWLRVLLSIDQFMNVLVLNGDEDETISSHAGKAKAQGRRWGCLLCRFLEMIDENHCSMSIEPDEGERTDAIGRPLP